MTTVKSKSTIEVDSMILLEIPEAEARMLLKMTCSGADAFLEGYYKVLGKSYMKPHEHAVRSFFKSIHQH